MPSTARAAAALAILAWLAGCAAAPPPRAEPPPPRAEPPPMAAVLPPQEAERQREPIEVAPLPVTPAVVVPQAVPAAPPPPAPVNEDEQQTLALLADLQR